MPAKDHYHDAVVRALIKDGWAILRQQYPIRVEFKRLWIDLSAEKEATTQAIFVEVKDFEDTSSVEMLRDAIGQLFLYRAALKYANLGDIPVFLAIPTSAFAGIFGTPLGKLAVQEAGINLLVFDPIDEVIVQWLPYTK